MLKIKNLFTFLLFLVLVCGLIGCSSSPPLRLPDIKKPGKHPLMKDVELTCQRPVVISTGRGDETHRPLFKDYFAPIEEVWVALDLDKIETKEGEVWLYVVEHKTGGPEEDTPLEDVSGKPDKLKLKPLEGGFLFAPVWNKPEPREEGYDVVADLDCDGFYNKDRDILDTGDKGGFYVPEHWVCLESVSFNHTKDYICCDALTIRMGKKENVPIPEWKREKRPFPAAYIAGTPLVTVDSAFLAAKSVEKAVLEAKTSSGKLSGLQANKITFKTKKSILKRINFFSKKKRNRSSDFFQVSGSMPSSIQVFDQEWQWYLSKIKLKGEEEFRELPEKIDITATAKQEGIHIATTVNRIYIVLGAPRCPWGLKGKFVPWASVLGISCREARGKTDMEEAAVEITKYLYEKINANYTDVAHFSLKNDLPSSFNLTKFLDEILPVDAEDTIPMQVKVNCYDMAKALVIFTNVLGGGMLAGGIKSDDESKAVESEFVLNDIQPVGWEKCKDTFENHAFAMLGKKVFDASLIVVRKDEYGRDIFRPMINIPLVEYIKELIKKGQPTDPKVVQFQIK